MLVKEGKMTQEQFDQWKSDTPNADKLPYRIHMKKTIIRKAKKI